MDFIIDRTSEDVMYAQSFIGAVWSKMSNEQKEEWLRGMQTGQTLNGLKGFFNYTDMLRIKQNYNSLRTTYSYTGQDAISTTYNMSEMPNRSVMSADFNKILQFGIAKLPYFHNASYSDYRTLDLSTDVNRIDYNFVNNYEHILKNLYDFNADGFLNLECEYDIEQNYIELDGIIIGSNTHKVDITVPSGYFLTVEKGHFLSHGYVVSSTITYKTDGQANRINLDSTDYGVQFKVSSGIVTDNYVLAYGTGGNSVDVHTFDKVTLDCDMLQYSLPTTYEATEVQSSMIDVSDLVKMYCYDISVYGDNTIVTLYDENEDMLDEIALRENTFIDLTNASYITFDTDVGTEITYVTSDGTSLSQLIVTIDGTSYMYPEETTFDVSGVNSISLSNYAPYNNKFVCTLQKSITGGLDISQLDTDDIEVKYI